MNSGLSIAELVHSARQLAAHGKLADAEVLCLRALAAEPSNAVVLAALGQMALDRGAPTEAVHHFLAARLAEPTNPQHGLDGAFALLAGENFTDARALLADTVAQLPHCFNAWLMLGQVFEVLDDLPNALRSFNQAVLQAQRQGHWLDEATTPPEMLDTVTHAIAQVRVGRRALYFSSYDSVRELHGSAALKRVDHALSVYLKEVAAAPTSPHQRARFFHFPGLPAGPYHDPLLQPWAGTLRDAFSAIRTEALQTLAEDSQFEDFIAARDGKPVRNHLRGRGRDPAWEALFFYRRSVRYDATHQRCPRTSEVLESLDLCRIEGDAPEICFSVLAPGTEILPHHGVSNIRLVMHLPLSVPAACALNVFGGGEHHWREGELVMFDDTYRHEAWNWSDSKRVVLLMDCWNPHLSSPERQAVQQLIETIAGFRRTDASLRA